ncbi:MAG: hypothetical protein SGPRY_010544 [Prymnesium sp.]
MSRLTVAGEQLLEEGRRPAVLRGFSLLFMLDSIFDAPRRDTDDIMLQRLPRTNLVRLVMLHWDDKPTALEGTSNRNDCAQTSEHRWVVQAACLDQIEKVLQWTASHGLWAVITARASLAAG